MMKNKKNISEYLHNYRFNSIFVKNMLRLLLLAVVPLIFMALISYYSYSNMQRQEIEAYSEKIIGDCQGEWERILGEAKAELGYIAFSNNVELFMYDTTELKQLHYSLYSIQDLIKMPVISKKHVDNIYIYSEKNNMVVSKEGTADYTNSRSRFYIDAYKKQEGDCKILMVEDNYEGYFQRYIAIYQEIKYGPRNQGLAVVALKIEELLEAMEQSEDSIFYLTDGKHILCSNKTDAIGQDISTMSQYKLAKKGETVIDQGESIGTRSLEGFELEVLLVQKVGDYHNQLKDIRDIMYLLIAVTFLFMVGIAFLISVRIYQPISEIVSSIKKNQNVLVGEKKFLEKDELDYILQTISQSAIRKKDVDEELKNRIHLLKKAQSVALQSQINPHFLNNTLDTINWIAISKLGIRNEISEMTSALSKMLRMALENTDMIMPISAEIEHCKNYLSIQKRRYEDLFDVRWDIPEEIMGCGTIRIVLQPILENAIYHGIKPLSNGGHIDICARMENSIVEIDVSDNGLGMSEEELSSLRKHMTEDMIHESEHIGVANVNQRLKLYFGEEYGLVVESTEGIGTTVRIRMPQIPS